ncbi:MAG TPA: alpha/beta fold hydrolase [Candidatus Thalassarchaeaceae archaeon]|nr:alpha/beta fold hydrolase [Candidatus Thalassarchaeaceae archaeon]
MPSLVMMHGLTGTANLIRPLAESLLSPGMNLILPEATIPHPKRGFAWWLRDEPPSEPLNSFSLMEVDESVESIVDVINLESSDEKLILAGFSQGAAMATEVFMHKKIQHRVLGMVLISGKAIRPKELYEALLDNPIPVVWMHGDRDKIVSIEQAHELSNLIEKANCSILKLQHHKGHMVDLNQKNLIIEWIRLVSK